mgnify:CR=1 FL=1
MISPQLENAVSRNFMTIRWLTIKACISWVGQCRQEKRELLQKSIDSQLFSFLFLFYRISENTSGSFLPIHTIKPVAFTYYPFTSWSKWRDARIGIPNFPANTVPDSNVSRPRCGRVSSQMRSCLVPDSVVSPPRCGRISPRVWHQR